MMKKVIAGILLAAMAISMIACGKSDNKASKADSKKDVPVIKYNVNDLVTLGDYKGIEVTVEGDYEYTDERFERFMEEQFVSDPIYGEDKSKTTVEEDSIVGVDFVGSKDGVPFNGGSAENVIIDIKNNRPAYGGGYIDGFSEGLVGHSVGEEVACDVKFPDNYGSEELAGQAVVFTFKINYIAKPIEKKSELTDEAVTAKVAAQTSDSETKITVEEFLENYKEYYKNTLSYKLENDKNNAVVETVMKNCTVSEIPKELLKARIDAVVQYKEELIHKDTADEKTTLKDYCKKQGVDYDEFMDGLKADVKESTQKELVWQAIAEAEGLKVDDEAFKTYSKSLASSNGYEDEKALYKTFSVPGYDGERYFKLQYLTQQAEDFCVKNAVFNQVQATNDNASTKSDSQPSDN